MKKLSFLTGGIASLVFAGMVFAAAGNVENKPGKCCAKAQAEGKTCSHACCVEAAKAGNQCTKCGGSGKVETKPSSKT